MSDPLPTLAFDAAWLLWALPLALLPLWRRSSNALANTWLVGQTALQPDPVSRCLWALLQATEVLLLAALIVAAAGPHRPEHTVQRMGQGAEIVLVLDRSRSMDQGFSRSRPPPGLRGTGPQALDYYMSQTPGRLRESKGQAARALLADFTARRPDDRFAMVVFSTLPIRVHGFTSHNPVVQAAIAANDIGRGLSETQIGSALDLALDQFEGRPYNGSRSVMLVSDGGDRLEPETRARLARRLAQLRVAVYWLYLRAANSPGLSLADGDSAAAADSVPEVLLHNWFRSLATPYRAYEASDAEALAQAIHDVDQREQLPISQQHVLPRQDLAVSLQGLALGALLLLWLAGRLEIKQWH